MKVIVISKNTFSVTELSSVSDIAYNSVTDTYTITHGGGTATYSGESYRISILW